MEIQIVVIANGWLVTVKMKDGMVTVYHPNLDSAIAQMNQINDDIKEQQAKVKKDMAEQKPSDGKIVQLPK